MNVRKKERQKIIKMDIIKTNRVNGFDITLIYFEDIKGYEIQISARPYNEITETDGTYTNKKIALEVYNKILKEKLN